MEGRHLSVVIRRDPREVAAFARDPLHLPEWAVGLAQGELRIDGDALVVASPIEEVRVRFAPPNALGVLEHEVTLPDGATVHNPLRVVAHPRGSEVDSRSVASTGSSRMRSRRMPRPSRQTCSGSARCWRHSATTGGVAGRGRMRLRSCTSARIASARGRSLGQQPDELRSMAAWAWATNPARQV